ncbi:MAG: chromate resistance protein [Bacteroidota bacterium]|nr:chromate resistance protein [Bacteroidota bacterium]
MAEDRNLRKLFEVDRGKEYSALLNEAERLISRLHTRNGQPQLTEAQVKKLKKGFQQLKEAFTQLQHIDFFSSKSAKGVSTALQQISRYIEVIRQPIVSTSVGHYSRKTFYRKTWATRKHIHIDRLCSAWLIRRFIDSKAKFIFAPEARLPKGAIPFDVLGAEFTHHGDDCTFETLLRAFRIKDRALRSLAQIVHDVDLKDQKFGRTEARGFDVIIRSLSDSLHDDRKVLEAGSVILDSLYKYFLTKKKA